MDPLRLDSDGSVAKQEFHPATLEKALDVRRMLGTRGWDDAVSHLDDGDREVGTRDAGILGQERVQRHVRHLGRDLDPGDAPADDYESEKLLSPLRRLGLLGHFEQLDDASPYVHRIHDRLERPRVLLRPRNVVVIRDASDRDHQRVVGHHQLVVEQDLTAGEIDAGGLVLKEADLAVARHVAERIDDVARLHRADRDGGKERIKLEEVFLVDEKRVPIPARGLRLSDRASDVKPGESSAQDE